MKKLILLLAVALLATTVTMATSSKMGCGACHVPHHASTTDVGVPLWNPANDHDLSGMTIYSSSTLDASVGTPDGDSKLCLSCHDGTGSSSAVGGVGDNFTDDISNMHPVSFTYDDSLAASDGELHPPSSTITALTGTIAEDLLDDNSKVQCTSCHDPHNTSVPGTKNLKIVNTVGPGGGELCKTCHDK